MTKESGSAPDESGQRRPSLDARSIAFLLAAILLLPAGAGCIYAGAVESWRPLTLVVGLIGMAVGIWSLMQFRRTRTVWRTATEKRQ